MIYTLTLNPSIDYTLKLDQFKQGETNRSTAEVFYPGGKGINVSRVLKNLGITSTALGFTAGFSGSFIEKNLMAQGVVTDFVQLETGVTRINVKLKADVESEINANGPMITVSGWKEMLSKLNRIKKSDVLVLAGHIPSSSPPSLYREIMQYLADRDIKFVVDTTGDALRQTLAFKPFLIKPNIHELESFFDVKVTPKSKIIVLAQQLQQSGARNVLVSCGKDGAILLTEKGEVLHGGAPKGVLKNSVGAGDSMVAGFIAGDMMHQDNKQAFRLALACGSATAFSDDLADKEQIYELLRKIKIKMEELT